MTTTGYLILVETRVKPARVVAGHLTPGGGLGTTYTVHMTRAVLGTIVLGVTVLRTTVLITIVLVW